VTIPDDSVRSLVSQDATAGLDAFAAAIRRSESGSYEGNYGLVKAANGGLGAYQISRANWEKWSREAGLRGAVWSAKNAQDAVARYKMAQMFNQFGDWRLVAVAWFYGGEVANRVSIEGLGGSLDREMTRFEGFMREAQSIGLSPDANLGIGQPLAVTPTSDTAPGEAPAPPAIPPETELAKAQASAAPRPEGTTGRDERLLASQLQRRIGAMLSGLSKAIRAGSSEIAIPGDVGDPDRPDEVNQSDDVIPGGTSG
jgi:hypothetical protein